jgi:hypothetical protein
MTSEHRYAPEERNAFQQGFEDAANGSDEFMDNPHPHGTSLAMSWWDGWNNFHEQQDAQRRERNSKLLVESRDTVLQKLWKMTAGDVGELIGIEPANWESRCYEIASRLVKALGWEDAEAVYGLYLGPVSSRCKTFASREGLVRHGWIVTREGYIVDPTAWVFAAEDPAVTVLRPGTDEHFEKSPWYDEGAETLDGTRMTRFPPAREGQNLFELPTTALCDSVNRELNRKEPLPRTTAFTMEQFGWICRTPFTRWGEATAIELYAFLTEKGLEAVIPTDFRARAARTKRWNQAND